ncbi:glycosyltransferase [Acinetobacter haemolyticus]|uniref:glycosyltransferase n=1 Tax=Acinetobacter haemolyticus TaxID=29430 RepID=UPI001372FB90|nr:glycosyltransferase [Acinetobacter haemolyticus]NAR67538.1 glycosyltransferase [Acinetobacter haemolyticus]
MKRKIALVVSTPSTFNSFYRNHIIVLSQNFNVTLIANFNLSECDIDNVKKIHVEIQRKPSLISDVKVLFDLIRLFKKEKFEVVHSTTPKAGLLTQIAGKLARVKFRIHTFTGQVWATKTGYKREILKKLDSLIAVSATHLLADSFTQRDFLEDQDVVPKNKIQVLGLGSISGINTDKFRPLKTDNLREELNISKESFLYLYLGRLNRDKGILDLLAAFEKVYSKNPNTYLLLVGRDEEQLVPIIEKHYLFKKSISYLNFTKQPEKFMSMADVFCIPSYREGFGSVVIEAAACKTPSIGSNIYGLSDSIEDGKSGLLFKVGNINDLANKMDYCYNHSEDLKKYAEYGYERVCKNFTQEISSNDLLIFYKENIGKNL